MPVGDSPHSISEKKAALRELPKESKNISPIPREKGLGLESTEILGTKRPQPNGASSPSQHIIGSSATNGHLVYVRRKLETEQGKVCTSANMESIGSPDSKKIGREALKEQNFKHFNDGPCVPSAPTHASSSAASPALSSGGHLSHNSIGKPDPGKAVAEPSEAVITRPARIVADPPRSSNQDWKERFIRLQMFLKNNEQSSQEDYIRMLQSLSAVGRSRHAIELEKRAVNLLIEEGKELHRMKVLNVLGKLSPNDPSSSPTQAASPFCPPFRR